MGGTPNPVGENIRLLRERYLLTQAELAALADVTAKTVGSWETSRHEPNPRQMRVICDLFDVSPRVLRGDEELQEVTDAQERRVRGEIRDSLERLQPPSEGTPAADGA